MSQIFATQLTAVATLALAILALAAAVLAGLAFWKQSQEVGLLLEQNKRDTDERRRAQAARVFFFVRPPGDEDTALPYARNASELPVYDAVVTAPQFHGLTIWSAAPWGPGTIMPGETVPIRGELPPDPASRLRLTFRDSAGITWQREPDGTLTERLPREEVRSRQTRLGRVFDHILGLAFGRVVAEPRGRQRPPH